MYSEESASSKQSGQRRQRSYFYSIRTRLQALSLLIVLVPMSFATWSSLNVLKEHLADDISTQLKTDIAAASLYYQNEVNTVSSAIHAVSLDNTVNSALINSTVDEQTSTHLALLAVQYNLDFLLIIDAQNHVIASPFFGAIYKEHFEHHPVTARVIADQQDFTATVLEEHAVILNFFKETSKEITATPNLVIESANAVTRNDKLLGIVFGGRRVTGNEGLLNGMRETTDCERVHIVVGNRVGASGYAPGLDLKKNGFRFPVTLDYAPTSSSKRFKEYTCSFLHKKMVFDLQPVKMPGNEHMVAIVCARSKSSFEPLVNNIRNLMLGIFTVAIFLAVALSFPMSRSIAGPLQKLSGAMHGMREGKLDGTVTVDRNDEIGDLMRGFNNMVLTINDRMRALNFEINNRHHAEEKLAAESERLKVTLQSIADGVITTDTEGKIVMMNMVAEQLTGWPREQARGLYADEVFQVADAQTLKSVIHPITRALRHDGRQEVSGTLLLKSKNKKKIFITESSAPLLADRKKIIGAVLVFRDVSARRKMEADIAKARKLDSVGVLAGGIAHDFNNLLTAILGNLSLVKTASSEKDKHYNNIRDAEKATMRARDLAQQLLTFSKDGTPIKKIVALNEIIRESALFIAGGSQVKISFDLPDNLWLVTADAIQIGQVIDNLVINAMQAMNSQGEMKIAAANVNVENDLHPGLARGDYILLTVEDQGPGIRPENLDRIFDPYFTTKDFGNGLGLAICYSVIAKHGGHMSVESEPGRGAKFLIYLPAAPQQALPQGKKTSAEVSSIYGKGRILIMDDEKMVRTVAGSILQTLGYEVEFAANGEQAIELYSQALRNSAPFNCVILDLTIPGGLSGKDTLLELRKLDPKLCAIACSGYCSHPIMTDYAEHGFQGAVVKPYRMSELGLVLKEALA